MLLADPSLPIQENFRSMVDSFSALERTAGKIVIEGWPGPVALGADHAEGRDPKG
jgi:hypothetical protein